MFSKNSVLYNIKLKVDNTTFTLEKKYSRTQNTLRLIEYYIGRLTSFKGNGQTELGLLTDFKNWNKIMFVRCFNSCQINVLSTCKVNLHDQRLKN